HAIDAPPDPLAALRIPDVLGPADQRPHLLVIAPRLDDGGAEVLLLDILTDLREDWRLTVVTTMPDQQRGWFQFRQITTDIVPFFGAFADEMWQGVLDHLIASRGTSIALSHGSAFAYASLAGLKQRHPHLVTIDILHNDLPSGHIRNAVVASDSIDVHVAVSEKVSRSLAGLGVPPERIATIPNGVDTEGLFRPDRFERNAARRALGLPEKGCVLAWVGRLAEEKRPEKFLDIVAGLRARFPVTGIIVGDGPLAPQLATAIDRVKKSDADIRRIAHVVREDMAQIYVAADFLVMTSSIEGLPFVALEALACGCPTAATDVGDIGVVVRHGETGFLVPSDKTGDLVDLVASALRDETRLIRMRGQARDDLAASRFTRAKMVCAYRELLSRMQAASEARTTDTAQQDNAG
ncbi:MAG: glycosyltransferase family 4 protein, partial [Hyphomicrobiaceae bacterium]